MNTPTYPTCFVPQRLCHPRLRIWHPRVHAMGDHFAIHLVATPCDLCLKERANAAKTPQAIHNLD